MRGSVCQLRQLALSEKNVFCVPRTGADPTFPVDPEFSVGGGAHPPILQNFPKNYMKILDRWGGRQARPLRSATDLPENCWEEPLREVT